MRIRRLTLSTAIASALATTVVSAQPMEQQDTLSSSAQEANPDEIIADWNYDELYAKGMSVEKFLDAQVIDEEGDIMGEVEDLVIGAKDNRITDMVVETGGFLEIGDSHLLYPFDQAQIEGIDKVQVDIDGEHVEELSLFKDVEGDPLAGEKWRMTDLIGMLAYANGEPYGRVDDVVIDQSGDILGVIVQPDVMYDDHGYYAWPYVGYSRDMDIYEVPYDKKHAFGLETFRPEDMKGASQES